MEAVTRIVNRAYPEIKAGYHLPMLGRVEQYSQPTGSESVNSTLENPIYAVDVQPLDENFKPKGGLLRDLVVMLPYGGNQRGFFALPEPDTVIEFCFAYASPKLIMIRGVIPWGIELPPWKPGEAHWHSNADVWQGYDLENNWHRHTTGSIKESCEQIRECTAKAKQMLKSPKTWIGSDSENALQIMVELMTSVESALTTLATHTHLGGQVAPPDQVSQITQSATKIKDAQTKMEKIAE